MEKGDGTGRVLIVGAGGVGRVITHKCCQAPEVFSEIMLASRTLARCEQIRKAMSRDIRVARVDANSVPEVVALVKAFKPRLLINAALPYQDLALMDACLETGIDYLDTANYEPPDVPKYAYSWQWAYHEKFREKGLMALLGSGFDPGATNVFCAYGRKHLLDRLTEVDILDCNAGSHGLPFATNFNPEINIREITQRGKYWEDGRWRETEPLSVARTFDFPEIGPKKVYLLYHEELESLVKHFPEIERIRFWMTFSAEYLTHLRVLQNVGMTRTDPIVFDGKPIVPLKFLKALLPDPAGLGENYHGKTNIGCLLRGSKGGRPRAVYIYNVCDHAACYRETGTQAVSYTAGVPAMIGALLLVTGAWRGAGVFNVEEFDPDPFMAELNRRGLPWQVLEPGEEAGWKKV